MYNDFIRIRIAAKDLVESFKISFDRGSFAFDVFFECVADEREVLLSVFNFFRVVRMNPRLFFFEFIEVLHVQLVFHLDFISF